MLAKGADFDNNEGGCDSKEGGCDDGAQMPKRKGEGGDTKGGGCDKAEGGCTMTSRVFLDGSWYNHSYSKIT